MFLSNLKETYLTILTFIKLSNIIFCTLDDAHFVMLDNCENRKILGHNLLTATMESERHCAVFCVMQSGCTGFNILKQHIKYLCEFKSFSAPILACTHASVVNAAGITFYVKGNYQ